MSATIVNDFGSQYRDYKRATKSFRPVASTTYTPGMVVQYASLDLQSFPDMKTVGLPATSANQQGLVGVVSETWVGFNGSIGPATYTSPSSLTAIRGTQFIDTVCAGFHPGVLVDQSGTGAVTIVNLLSLIASRATSGYLQGASASAPAGGTAVIAQAALPASGIGSSITAAALAQAAQTSTIATPAAGDQPFVTIQSPYVASAPGVAQTTTWTMPPLTSAQAASATTAAAAFVAWLNAQPGYALYFTASNTAGAVSHTVNGLGSLFNVNFGSGTTVTSEFKISLSGMVANSLTFASGVTGSGGTTNTAGGANLAGGTGFKGYLPAWVGPAGSA